MNKNLIILYVKAPIPGLVKTRLGKDIGNEKACSLYKSFCEKIINKLKKTDADLEIHFYPEDKKDLISNWLGKDENYILQVGSDLGLKMANSFIHGFKKGYEKIVLTGSDIPDITSKIIDNAFLNINKNPVIGPCEDGGYYLIGFDDPSFKTSFFENIKWSSKKVLPATIKKMEEKNLPPFLLKELNDIDTINDLQKSDYKLKA